MDLLEFLSGFPAWTVIMIIAAGIIILVKIINGCKSLWAKRAAF